MCTSSVVFARLRQFVRRHSAVSCVKMGEPIDLPLGLWTSVGRMKQKFSRICQVAPCEGSLAPRGEYDWICGGDAALCQITLTTCYYYCAFIQTVTRAQQ